MGLQRALDSGVSGMLNNQLSLDVSANNLANVNTPGFKGARVSFSNSLIQTTFAGSAPGTNVGGQNPRQVGLGMRVSSIDLDFGQGALAATGRNTDLAIQGEGFFEVTDGTKSFYTRVGNFGIDSESNLVHLSSGYRLMGNTYRTDLNPDGSQTIQDQNVPIAIPQGQAFPPNQTTEIDFEGNLDASTYALQGTSVQSLYPLKDVLTGASATEETPLNQLNTFKDVTEPANPVDRDKTIYIFGTKPDGQTYAGSFTIDPWAVPTDNNPSGSLGDLVEKINNTLAQGNDRFGTARVENGNIIINAVGSGEAFSFFMGEDGAQVGPPAILASRPFVETAATFGPAGHLDADGANPLLDTAVLSQATPSASAIVGATGEGLLAPSFTVAGGLPLAAPFSVSVRINGRELGTINVPLGYDGTTPPDFSLNSFPHIQEGDVIEYAAIGSPPGTTITSATSIILDSDNLNLTQDRNGDGIADMFEEDSNVDANAWQYRNETNTTFNWYRSRFIPELVSSSIEVYDSQGGRHTVEMRFFRIGTRTEADSAARINSWDMVIDVPLGTGDMTDDLVTGIEFDQFGRYTGSIGTTIHNTSVNSTSYVGSPASATVQVDWASTGPTDPSTMRLNFGEAGSVNGLTGFGSTSTAAAVEQDGYTDGKLDNISVSSEGDVVALYTNGISRNIAQIPLVTFANPSGLNRQENSLWQITTNSGSPTRRTPGQNSGFVTSGALEGSNVDIATEFTRLITSQRGFQVNARVVQTTDEILEELANLVR